MAKDLAIVLNNGSINSAVARRDTTIMPFRPRDSEIAPATIMAGASRPVVSESARLLSAALT